MARRIITEIKSDYTKYKTLVEGKKNSKVHEIILSDLRENHVNVAFNSIELDHEALNCNVQLIVESKIYNKRDFKFKLRHKEFMPEPFFRFDSFGLAHWNKSDNLPLEEQKIDTPHFNCYDEKGREYAFQTDSLKNKGDAAALLDDISLAMAHFCDVSKTFCGTDYIQVNVVNSTELNLEFENTTPVDGIRYE